MAWLSDSDITSFGSIFDTLSKFNQIKSLSDVNLGLLNHAKLRSSQALIAESIFGACPNKSSLSDILTRLDACGWKLCDEGSTSSSRQ